MSVVVLMMLTLTLLPVGKLSSGAAFTGARYSCVLREPIMKTV
jgi:hypothetical protein